MKNKEMTIMATNIKNGGGLELLFYLVEFISINYNDVLLTVYVDKSISAISSHKNVNIIKIGSTLVKVKLFFKKIDNTLYFGNLPPMVKSNNSIVYIHNLYLLMDFYELKKSSFKFLVKYILQQIYMKLCLKNVSFVACQSPFIKEKISQKFRNVKIKTLPFFRLCDKDKLKSLSKIYDFCYISIAHPHKNYSRLLDACDILSDQNINFSIALTVNFLEKKLIQKIDSINNKGIVNIVNLGEIPKPQVCEVYAKSRCLIFPSTFETFGLSLIEAVKMELDVIASDLEYVYQSISPTAVFDPESAEDIALKMNKYLSSPRNRSYPKVNNRIEELIKILLNN